MARKLTNKKGSHESKPRLYLIIFTLVILTILGSIYYYMLSSHESLDNVADDIKTQLKKVEKVAQKSELESKDAQIKLLQSEKKSLKESRDSAPAKLRYSIKPKEKVIAHCKIMKIGRWNMPQSCASELIEGIKEIVAKDQRIVAFEVSGIVDNLPYGGLSPELKQEGLASFRAKEAIIISAKNMPNVAVFEGLSQQKADQRGFVVRAYYVE